MTNSPSRPSKADHGRWHGQWTLDIRRDRRAESGFAADFSADMTMSDYGTTNGLPDGTKGGQSPHTHHIKLTNQIVIANMDGCPTVSPAALTGFQFGGTVSLITGNGTNAPFEKPNSPPVSTLQVCITGGDQVPRGLRFYEFEHFTGLRRTRDNAFRNAGHSWRRAQRNTRPKRERSIILSRNSLRIGE